MMALRNNKNYHQQPFLATANFEVNTRLRFTRIFIFNRKIISSKVATSPSHKTLKTSFSRQLEKIDYGQNSNKFQY